MAQAHSIAVGTLFRGSGICADRTMVVAEVSDDGEFLVCRDAFGIPSSPYEYGGVRPFVVHAPVSHFDVASVIDEDDDEPEYAEWYLEAMREL